MAQTETVARPKAGTRWKRFAMVAVPAFGVSGVILGLTAQGALAASFAVAGTNFRISADRLVGTGMVQYGTVDVGGNGAKHPVAVNGFKSVDIYKLCQSMVVPSPFGDMTIKLTAGSKDNPVDVTNMVTDLDLLTGDVTFIGPNIGIDGSKVSKGPIKGETGQFALEADKVEINNVNIQAWSTTAGTFVLKGLKMTAGFGKDECF